MKKLRSVLVGTGGWAETHAKAYQISKDVELVGICGHQNTERLDKLAEDYGIPDRSMDLGGLLERTQPDILDIACNPHFRLDGVRKAIISSIKLINLEKPLALAPSEAYEIEKLCLENNKLLTVNHQTKFIPSWKKAKSIISAGKIGEIKLIRASCQGNLLEQGTHLVDATMFFNEYCPVRWVMGQVDELEGLEKVSAAAPDAAIATMCFENGVRAVLDFGTVGGEISAETGKWHNYWVEIYGSRGHIKITLNDTMETVIYENGISVTEESSWDSYYIVAQAGHIDAAARYISDPNQGHISCLSNSLASFNAIMGIYASAGGEGRVTLPRRFDDGMIARLIMRKEDSG